MGYHCKLRRLSNQFYRDYDTEIYLEILKTSTRTYNVAIFEGIGNYYICVPFRTDIRHSSAFKFKNTKRSSNHQYGIDYKKMIIITKDKYNQYIDFINPPLIDNDEYVIYRQNLDTINREALDYLQKYINHHSGIISMSEREYRRKYQYTTLHYFHNELGI